MSLYMPTIETPGSWPAKIEGILGGLGAGAGHILSKVTHLSLAEELFIAAVAATKREHRPWGIISWVAEVFGVSRPTVYALGERVQVLLASSEMEEPQDMSLEMGQRQADKSLERLVLTCAFPGGVSLRSMQEIVSEALGKAPSLGGLSEFLLATGQQAGEILEQIDYSPLGPVMVVRDETYWQNWPILLVIEPVTTTILFGDGVVCCPETRSADGLD
ncbi:MAG: hypothetical protein JXB07_19370 [Anaerolineae bacterium]|nr:hypothetical protein [Anaerolineae bacterium]